MYIHTHTHILGCAHEETTDGRGGWVWGAKRGKGLRDPNRIRLLNKLSDLDLEIGMVRDMSETLVLLYIYTYIYTYIHTYIPTYIHTHIQTYTYSYIHTYIHIYTYTNIHICIHTYIHISPIRRFEFIRVVLGKGIQTALTRSYFCSCPFCRLNNCRFHSCTLPCSLYFIYICSYKCS